MSAATGVRARTLLGAEQHRGEGPVAYGRPGRIAGSVNVSARDMVDRTTGAFLPENELRAGFESVGATSAGRVITYCGGGIAATADALVLTLLGHEGVAVYDDSLSDGRETRHCRWRWGEPLSAGRLGGSSTAGEQ